MSQRKACGCIVPLQPLPTSAALIFWHPSYDTPGGSRFGQALRVCVVLSSHIVVLGQLGGFLLQAHSRAIQDRMTRNPLVLLHAKPGKLYPHFVHWLQRLARNRSPHWPSIKDAGLCARRRLGMAAKKISDVKHVTGALPLALADDVLHRPPVIRPWSSNFRP